VPQREQTPAEHLWELHDRGFLDDEAYAAALREMSVSAAEDPA
jgi:hypothetical protein